MKILHVAQIHWYNAEVQYAWDLARWTAREGHEVHALTRPGTLAEVKAREAELIVHTEDGFNAKGLASWRALGAASRFSALLRRERFDAVAVHRSEGMALIAYLCRREGVPCIRVRGDMRPVKKNPVNAWVYHNLLSAVVASNSTIASDLDERLGIKAQVIYGGVDERHFNPDGPNAGIKRELGLEPGAFLVGILGRMVPLKGHLHFLNAASHALRQAPEAAFVILVKSGRDPLPEVRERLKAEPYLESRVRFLGQRNDLPAVLRDFGLGVVASTGSEANCRVGLEWMASGVPLLASRVGVLQDIVDEGQTGFVVTPGRASEMAAKIVYLATRPDEAVRMGRLARQRVEERFTLARTASEFTRLTQKLTGER